ncbi:MAG: translocation/assembly module TamB domain-containing protein [Paraglaciecola sp.]|uniref:autotransporter assembly complex protein TamB n=2 Tax=Paraglaciecola sp. TaxID=1920173 RepID=UPI003298B2D6
MSDKAKDIQATHHTSTKRKLVKLFYRTMLAFLIVLVLVVGFIFTPYGAKVLLNTADSMLEPLDIEYGSGGLSSELNLTRLEWRDAGTQAVLNDLTVSISFECIWQLAVCVDSLSTSKVAVNIAKASPPDSRGVTTSVITMPIPVSVKNIDISNLSVSLENTLNLTWLQLNGELSFYKELHVPKVQLKNLIGTTYANETAQPTTSFDWSRWQYEPLQTLPIILPIHFNILDFTMLDTELNIAGQELIKLKKVNVQATGNSNDFELSELYVEHQLGHINVKGDIQFDGELTHELTLDGQGLWPENNPVTVAIASNGSIQKVTTTLNVVSGDNAYNSQTAVTALSAEVSAQLSRADLPLNASLSWENLGWPLTEPNINSAAGDVKLSGSLDALKLIVTTGLSGEDIPDAQLNILALAQVNAKQKSLSLDKLFIKTLAGEVNTKGSLDFAKVIAWQGSTQVQNIKPGVFWPDIQAEINGTIPTKFNNSNGSWEFDSEALDIDGLWQNYPLSITGAASFVENGQLKIRDLLIKNAENQLFVTGTVQQQQELIDLNIKLDAPEIADSFPQASGAMSLVASVKGALFEPEVNYDLSAEQLRFSDITVADATGAGQLKWGDHKPIDMALTLSGIQGMNNQVDTATLSLTGDPQNHNLELTTTGETTSINVQIEGQLNDTSWQGRWLTGKLTSSYANLNLVDEFEIQADWGKQAYSIGSHCWRQQESELCVTKAQFQKNVVSWDLAIKEFNLLPVVRRFMPTLPALQTNSRLALESSGTWDIQSLPIATVNVGLSPAKWTFTAQDNFQIDIQDLSLSASTNADDIRVDLNFIGPEIGQFTSSIQAQPASLDGILGSPIKGELLISEFNLAPFLALAPQLEVLQGVIKGQSEVLGTVSSPLLKGELAWVNGELKGESLPVWLSDIQQKIVLNGNHADFSGSYRLGKGPGELKGQIAWVPSLSGNLNISGNALEFDYQNIVKASISPDVTVEFVADNVAVNGEISIPYARVKVRDLPQGAVSLSDDVILVEQEAQKQQSAQKLALDLLIKVDPLKADEVKLDAFGLTTDLQGQLRLRNKKADLLASGEIQLVNGKYKAYGQNLVIREGDILFNTTLDKPYLNIEAIRDPDLTEDDVVAGLRVEGGVESPTVTVFSEPEMEQQQSLSYILTGRGLGDSSDDSQDTILTNALLSLGLGQSENLVSKAGNKLGFQDVSLDTSGQGDDTQLSLTGTISPGVQLRYGVGVFDSESEVAIRYELLPKLYLEAVSGLESTLDIYYQFSLGNNENMNLNED